MAGDIRKAALVTVQKDFHHVGGTALPLSSWQKVHAQLTAERIQNASQQKCHLPLAPASAGCCCHVAKHTPVCVSIQPPLLSGQRVGRETLRARWVGAASCWQCLSGGLLSPACQAPWQLPATTCKQPPRTLLFVPRCHGMEAPTWSEESVWLHAAPRACERL